MTIECTYIAFDDTEFSSEEECLAYEKKLKDSFKSVIFFDEKMNIIEEPNFERVESESFFFQPVDATNFEFFLDWLKYEICFQDIKDPLVAGHFYAYSGDLEVWIDITKRSEEMVKTVETLKGMVNKWRFPE